jgi:hypothetical protein
MADSPGLEELFVRRYLSYPTTVLIDRESKVLGKFEAWDEKAAVAEIEKLLRVGK